ncbi:MAG: AMP-binding protein [Caldilineales bacterium]|nr:AMP-binding protein [Caldilineales bacterium]
MSGFDFGGEFVWHPEPDALAGSHLMELMRNHGLVSPEEVQKRAIADVGWFAEATLQHLGIEFYEPYSQIVDLSRGKPWATWCVGGRMNIVHNCLDRWMGTATERKTTLRWEGEEGEVRTLTYAELNREVNRTANALRSLGLGKGDAVGLYMPMTPEIAIALLAVAKIGGIILPLFSGYGAGAVATRLSDAGARALFCADGAYRRGRVVNMKSVADEALSQTPEVEHVIVHRRTGIDIPWTEGRDHWWHELIPAQSSSAPTEKTSAEDVLMIIYTSGTTGRPKGAVHTHCGFPIKAAQDLAFGFDLRADDTLYWMTDMGWMMGPWQVFGTLLLGSTMLFYDGAPDFPDVDRVWKLVADHRVTTLGVSPTLIRALMARGDEPVKRHDLASLRAFGSTGEPWNPGPWMWLFQTVGEGRRPIINYSGGTEISGGIVGGNMFTPLKPAAFAGPSLGIAADVVDEEGRSIRGQVGELVIRQPWIGMTRGFWRDPDRYIETYWSRFPDVWVHGDFAAIDADGQWYILGRSDDTIKIAGKRLGPAEIESILVHHPAVVEAGAIGVPDAIKGSALVCFAVLAPGVEPNSALANELGDLVAAAMGKALRPQAIVFVPDLPKTRNAKVMRRVLRAAYLDEPPGDLSALVNPEVVEEIRKVGRDED